MRRDFGDKPGSETSPYSASGIDFLFESRIFIVLVIEIHVTLVTNIVVKYVGLRRTSLMPLSKDVNHLRCILLLNLIYK